VKIVWYSKAERDLQDATSYIEARNPHAADKVEARLQAAIEHLQDFPKAGRTGRRLGTQEIVVVDFPYLIRYRINKDRVEILRIFHTSMQWVLR